MPCGLWENFYLEVPKEQQPETLRLGYLALWTAIRKLALEKALVSLPKGMEVAAS